MRGLSSGPTSAAESSLIRLINSLMARFNSLFSRNKFPVPKHREVCSKPLDSLLDFPSNSALQGLVKFPVNSPAVSQANSSSRVLKQRTAFEKLLPIWRGTGGFPVLRANHRHTRDASSRHLCSPCRTMRRCEVIARARRSNLAGRAQPGQEDRRGCRESPAIRSDCNSLLQATGPTCRRLWPPRQI